MSITQVSVRVIVYALVLSAIDAVAGRMFRAAPDPSVFLSLGATAWIAYGLTVQGQSRVAIPAALALFAIYILAFLLWSNLLVGWNGAVAWAPPSTRWMIGFVALAPVVAVAGWFAGTRARARATVANG